MNSQHILQNDYSAEISRLRNLGKLDEAIDKCYEAVSAFPDNNFFYKILGDICAQAGRWKEASDAYLENIKRLEKHPKHFRTFIKFYQLFEQKAPEEIVLEFNTTIRNALAHGQIPPSIADYIVSFLGDRLTVDEELRAFYDLTDSDKNLSAIEKQINSWLDQKNTSAIKAVAHYRMSSTDHSKSKHNDSYIIQALERIEDYTHALQLLQASQQPYNFSAIFKILRICRRIGDYSFAESALSIDENFISHSDFNIQYELVYYFQSKNDQQNLKKTLKAMRISARRSIPIARTLYNFYLGFNMFDEAEEVYDLIQSMEQSKREQKASHYVKNNRQEEQFESEQVVWQRLKDLVSEQEHTRQMIALSDLLKGFSHELGQPITNIRYAVQLHKLKMEKGKDCPEDIDNLLNTVLDQTQRIGVLLARFRPIVSSKSQKEWFSIKACIESVVHDLDIRLKLKRIEYTIGGPGDLVIYGDPVQFSQVFYNLILNSMQAIGESGKIKAIISSDRKSEIRISFSDNGPGIPEENRHKVFEPFFSTKEPSDENGGEGLGLFIVWNILKMFDGTIRLDDNNKKGAKFIIKLPFRKEDDINESSINNRRRD